MRTNLTQRLAHAFVPRRFSESRQESLSGGDLRTPLFPDGLANQESVLPPLKKSQPTNI